MPQSVGVKYDHVYFWGKTKMRPLDRKGQRCRVLVRGRMNTVLIEFEDGFQVTTSRFAVRRKQD